MTEGALPHEESWQQGNRQNYHIQNHTKHTINGNIILGHIKRLHRMYTTGGDHTKPDHTNPGSGNDVLQYADDLHAHKRLVPHRMQAFLPGPKGQKYPQAARPKMSEVTNHVVHSRKLKLAMPCMAASMIKYGE